jgi:hypothetical protein
MYIEDSIKYQQETTTISDLKMEMQIKHWNANNHYLKCTNALKCLYHVQVLQHGSGPPV